MTRSTSRPVYWVSLLFSVALFGVAVYGGLFNPESLQHLSKGKLVAFDHSHCWLVPHATSMRI